PWARPIPGSASGGPPTGGGCAATSTCSSTARASATWTGSRPRSATPTRCGSCPPSPVADDKRGGPAYGFYRAPPPSGEVRGRRHGGAVADPAADVPGGRWGGPGGRLAGRALGAAQHGAATAGPDRAGPHPPARGAPAGGPPRPRPDTPAPHHPRGAGA